MAVSDSIGVEEAIANLQGMASLILAPLSGKSGANGNARTKANERGLDYEARYRALIERIPAVVFVAPMEAASGIGVRQSAN